MQETRYAIVNGEKIPVLISDENDFQTLYFFLKNTR